MQRMTSLARPWLIAFGLILSLNFVEAAALRPDTFSRPMSIKLVSLTGAVGQDNAQFAIADDATPGFDAFYDAYKLRSNTVDMWMTPVPGVDLTINYMPRNSGAPIAIPLNFTSVYTGMHQFEFTNDSNLIPFNTKVALTDLFTNTTYDITLQKVITFDVIAGTPASFTNRFVLNYSPIVTLLPTTNKDLVFVAPNPAIGGHSLRIELPNEVNQTQELQILTSNGSCVYTNQVGLIDGQMAVNLPKISKGLYSLILISAKDRKRRAVRLVID
jgi:hypothetical protein